MNNEKLFWIFWAIVMIATLFYKARVQKRKMKLNTAATSEHESISKNDANLVQLVQFKCKYARAFVSDIKSDNKQLKEQGSEKLESYIKTCLGHAGEVSDDFCKSATLHSIADLLSEAGQYDRASSLIDLIVVDFMQEQARKTLLEEKRNNLSRL